MALNRALFIAKVAHNRLRPKKNGFCYHVYYLSLPLGAWDELKRLAVFSLDRFNVFSLHAKDYGQGKPEPWMRGILAEWKIPEADGEIVLVTLPRVLGYAFNPVSFWFCLDKAGALRAVLAEVHNTFGEAHSYLLFHDDHRPITSEDWLMSDKLFHVSPFIEITGHYQFRFAYGEEKLGVWINHHDAGGLLLTTSMAGRRTPLTSPALLKCFFRYPLVTMKVIGLIHYQAVKLKLKGIRYRLKPPQRDIRISR